MKLKKLLSIFSQSRRLPRLARKKRSAVNSRPDAVFVTCFD